MQIGSARYVLNIIHIDKYIYVYIICFCFCIFAFAFFAFAFCCLVYMLLIWSVICIYIEFLLMFH